MGQLATYLLYIPSPIGSTHLVEQVPPQQSWSLVARESELREQDLFLSISFMEWFFFFLFVLLELGLAPCPVLKVISVVFPGKSSSAGSKAIDSFVSPATYLGECGILPLDPSFPGDTTLKEGSFWTRRMINSRFG